MGRTAGGYGSVLRGGEFRALFAAHVVSMLGDIVAAVALTVLVYQRTRSAALAASVLALSFVPYLLTGTLAGVIAERWPARRVMVACNLASAALVAPMTIPGLPVPALLGMLFAASLVAPIFQGVRAAALPAVLPPGRPYVLGRSLLRLVSQSAQVTGYALGGVLVGVTSPRAALGADAASFVLSALWVWRGLQRRPPPAATTGTAEPRPVARAPASHLRAVLSRPRLGRLLWFTWLVPACAVAPEALATPYVTHIGLPAHDVGYLLCGLPIGSVAGDVLVGRLLSGRNQRRAIVPAAALMFIPLLSFVWSPSLAVAIAVLVVSGLGAYSPGADALLVDLAPDDLRTYAIALSGTGLMFFQGVGFAAWGLAGEVLSPQAVIVAASLLGLAAVATLGPRR